MHCGCYLKMTAPSRWAHLHRPATGKRDSDRYVHLFRGGCGRNAGIDAQAVLVSSGPIHHEKRAHVGKLVRSEKDVFDASEQVSPVALHELGQVTQMIDRACARAGQLVLCSGQGCRQIEDGLACGVADAAGRVRVELAQLQH